MDFASHPVFTATDAAARANGCACTVDGDGSLAIDGPDGAQIIRVSIAGLPFNPDAQQVKVMILELEAVVIARDASVMGQAAYGTKADGTVERIEGMSMSTNADGTFNMSFKLSDEELAPLREATSRAAAMESFGGQNAACDDLAAAIFTVAWDLEMEPERTSVEEVAVFLDPQSVGEQGGMAVTLNIGAMAADGVDPRSATFQAQLGDWLTEERAALGTVPDDLRAPPEIVAEAEAARDAGEVYELDPADLLAAVGFGPDGAPLAAAPPGEQPSGERIAALRARYEQIAHEKGVTPVRISDTVVSIRFPEGAGDGIEFDLAEWAAKGEDPDSEDYAILVSNYIGMDVFRAGQMGIDLTRLGDPEAQAQARAHGAVSRARVMIKFVATELGLDIIDLEDGAIGVVSASGASVRLDAQSLINDGHDPDSQEFTTFIAGMLGVVNPGDNADGWFGMHLRRDGQDFYEAAAVVDRFSSGGLDFALICHYEDEQSLRHLGRHDVAELGGEQAVRDRVLRDRDRMEFIVEREGMMPDPTGQGLTLPYMLGHNLATMLVHPGLHRRLIDACGFFDDPARRASLCAPDAAMGPIMAFAPTTSSIVFLPTPQLSALLPGIIEWSHGIPMRGEELMYGCLLRDYPDPAWGIVRFASRA